MRCKSLRVAARSAMMRPRSSCAANRLASLPHSFALCTRYSVSVRANCSPGNLPGTRPCGRYDFEHVWGMIRGRGDSGRSNHHRKMHLSVKGWTGGVTSSRITPNHPDGWGLLIRARLRETRTAYMCGTRVVITPSVQPCQFGLVCLLFFVKFDKIRSFFVFWGHW